MGDTKVADLTGQEEAEASAIEDCGEEFGMSVSRPVRDALIAYGRLLLTWGQRINLTAARSGVDLVSGHLPDAFAMARRLARQGGAGQRVVDVGSGGGLPALPLALLRPESSFTLFEATGKKVAFLRTAIRTLKLGDRVQAEHMRVARASPIEGSFDVAMSRAALPPREWLQLAWCLVRPGGAVFCFSSQGVLEWPLELALVGQTRYRPNRWLLELRRST